MAEIDVFLRFFEFFSNLNDFLKNLRREQFDPKNEILCSYLTIKTKFMSYLQPNLQNKLSKMGQISKNRIN